MSKHSHQASRACKRITDFVVSALGLVVLSPVVLATAIAVRIGLGKPVLFRQSRPGLHGKVFDIFKFRTMRDAVDAQGNALPDAERLTPLGRTLRATSLDELPELINVIRGEMSLVGPRPLRVKYLSRYSPEQARRHEVPPGITGWAQVNGRNATNWPERFALDVYYVDNWSLALDARILWMTLWRVLKREGISQEGHATMPEFMGNEQTETLSDS